MTELHIVLERSVLFCIKCRPRMEGTTCDPKESVDDDSARVIVVYDGNSFTERLIAASLASDAIILDRANITRIEELHRELSAILILPPAFLTLSYFDIKYNVDSESSLNEAKPDDADSALIDMLSGMGFESIYLAVQKDAAERDEYTYGKGIVKHWKAPRLPIAIRGGVPLTLISIAYTLEGYTIPSSSLREAEAFRADFNAGMFSPSQQITFCKRVCKSFEGGDIIANTICRGHGRILERKRIKDLLTQKGIVVDII